MPGTKSLFCRSQRGRGLRRQAGPHRHHHVRKTRHLIDRGAAHSPGALGDPIHAVHVDPGTVRAAVPGRLHPRIEPGSTFNEFTLATL